MVETVELTEEQRVVTVEDGVFGLPGPASMVNASVSEAEEVPQTDCDFTTTFTVPRKALLQSIVRLELVSPGNKVYAVFGMISQRYFPRPALVETIELMAAHNVVVPDVGVFGTATPDCNVKIRVSEDAEVPQTDCAFTTTLAIPVKASFQLITRVELVSPA